MKPRLAIPLVNEGLNVLVLLLKTSNDCLDCAPGQVEDSGELGHGNVWPDEGGGTSIVQHDKLLLKSEGQLSPSFDQLELLPGSSL